jgi:hypothetical protein
LTTLLKATTSIFSGKHLESRQWRVALDLLEESWLRRWMPVRKLMMMSSYRGKVGSRQ